MNDDIFVEPEEDDEWRGTEKNETKRTGDHAPHTCRSKHGLKNRLSLTLKSTCIITPHASMSFSSKRNLRYFVTAPALDDGPKSWRFVCVCEYQH